MAAAALAAIKAGKAAAADAVAAQLQPLLRAAGDAERKKAAAAHGKFVLQAATLIGQALGKKGLPEAQARALLAAARHVLGGLMAIAPHAKPPLRVEKLAMGLLQKHLDAQQFADAAPHVDALLAHLGTVHSAPDAKARKVMLKTLAKYSAYEWHGTGGCESCCLVFLPRPGSDAAFGSLALSCLQARLQARGASAPGGAKDSASAAVCCAMCACLLWLDHVDAADAQLSRRHRGGLVRTLHQLSALWLQQQRSAVGPFLNYVMAVETIMQAGRAPANVGLHTCVDQMAKAEELITEKGGVVADGYRRAIQSVTRADAARVPWAVQDGLKMVERYCRGSDTATAEEMWKHFIAWCRPRDNDAAVPANALAHAACVLRLGLLYLEHANSDAESYLKRAADLFERAAERCFEDTQDGSTETCGDSSGLPLEYNALMRMVCRGGVLLKTKEIALNLVQTITGDPKAAAQPVLLALENVMGSTAVLMASAYRLEKARAVEPAKYEKMLPMRLEALRAASALRVEHELLGVAAPRPAARKRQTASPTVDVERALGYLKEASDAVAEACPANHELMREVAKFSWNTGVRLSNCERFEEAIQALSQSCLQLRECRGLKDSIVPALCTRYSLLAKCREKTGNVGAAVACLEEALVQVAASCRGATLGNREHLAPLVFQHVSAYLTLAAEQASKPQGKSKGKGKAKPTVSRGVADFLTEQDRHISNIQLGVILEEYVAGLSSAGFRLKIDTRDMQLAIVDELLQSVYKEADACTPQLLGRARALLLKAKLLRLGARLSGLDAASGHVADAIGLLDQLSSRVAGGSAEQVQVLEHVAVTHSWHAMMCVERQVLQSSDLSLAASAAASLDIAATSFSQVLIDDCDGPFCDLEEMWSTLQILSDYCRVMGRHSSQLHFLRMRYKLVSAWGRSESKFESSLVSSDCVEILAEMSRLHTQLGFSEHGEGLAGQASDKTKAPEHQGKASTERAGVYADLARALSVCRSTRSSECIPDLQELVAKTKSQRGRSWSAVAASCKFCLAEALWHQGEQIRAVQAAMDALQIRAGLVPGCQELMAQETTGCRSAVPAQSIHDGEDRHVISDIGSEKAVEGGVPSKAFCVETQSSVSTWDSLHNLLESLEQTGSYAARSGRGVEGESYLQAGLNVAERICADSWKTRMLCSLAQIHHRRHDGEKCREDMEQLLTLHSVDSLEYVRVLAACADYHRRNDNTEKAAANCEEGMTILETMRHPKFLKNALHSAQIGQNKYSVADDDDDCIAVCGQQPEQLVRGKEKIPHQLKQAQATLETKRARIWSICGDEQEAQKLFKRALGRTVDASPELRAVILYHTGCQHQAKCTADAETAGHLWSLHEEPAVKCKVKPQRKGRGRKPKDEGAAGASASSIAARKCFDEALAIACEHSMAGLATKTCHRLAAMTGRRGAEQTCCMLQASLCVPLCQHMRTLLSSRAGSDTVDVHALAEIFSVRKLLGTPAAQFQEQYIDCLPTQWTVCSCTVEYATSGQPAALLLTRMVGQRKPTVLRLPMEEGEDNLLISATAGWEKIMQGNLDSLQGHSNTNPKSKKSKPPKLTKAQKSAWWEQRANLDNDMQKFLQKMERSWLGGFKGVLLGQPTCLDGALADRAAELKERVFGKYDADPALLEVILSSADLLDDEELECACADIIVGQVGSFRTEQPEAIGAAAKSAAQAIREAFEEMRDRGALSCARGPTVLLLGAELQQLPWESLPCLRSSGQSITRMPCLPFVLARNQQPSGAEWLWHIDPGVQPSRTFYVLNPAGDLVATQETFEGAFSERNSWEGVSGKAPTSDEYKNALLSKDLFIYCGHSTGERYFRGAELAKLGRCAVTMLMGCSSGRLTSAGDCGVEGMPLCYLLAGCPALVANLWDVTDKDIDKFSSVLIDSWVDGKREGANSGDGEAGRTLTEELPLARKSCKFAFLNGAAPVCYGVPVELSEQP